MQYNNLLEKFTNYVYEHNVKYTKTCMSGNPVYDVDYYVLNNKLVVKFFQNENSLFVEIFKNTDQTFDFTNVSNIAVFHYDCSDYVEIKNKTVLEYISHLNNDNFDEEFEMIENYLSENL